MKKIFRLLCIHAGIPTIILLNSFGQNNEVYANNKPFEENVIERQYENFKSDKIYLKKFHKEYRELSLEIQGIASSLENMNISFTEVNKLRINVEDLEIYSIEFFNNFKHKFKNVEFIQYLTKLKNSEMIKIHVLKSILEHYKKHVDSMLYVSKTMVFNDNIKFINNADNEIIKAHNHIDKFIKEKDIFFDQNDYNEPENNKNKNKKRQSIY